MSLSHNKAKHVSDSKRINSPAKKTTLEVAEIRSLFADWLACPQSYRRPSTQARFARKYRVHPVTLTRWKVDPEFSSSVQKLIGVHAKLHCADVFQALVKLAMAGNLDAIRLWCRHVLGWSDDAST